MAAEAPQRSPLRLAGRIAAALIGVAFVALLAYGLVTKSPDRTVDDGLRKSGSVAAPALNQPVLERGDLGELEVSSGGTTIILRAPSAIAAPVAVAAAAPLAEQGGSVATAAPDTTASPAGPAAAPAAAKPAVNAPLTGIYYGAPSPGATPYVAVGDHVAVGQIIGLIEAMKLFNEIKSDRAGRVTRICVESGALVKAKQALIEVEPT